MPPIPGYNSRDLGMLVSEAQGQRSRGKRLLTVANTIYPPGTLLTGPVVATVGTAVDGILLYAADTHAAVYATTLERDCEVNDAYLIQGSLVYADIGTALAKTGIVVREGVLTALGATFATPRLTDPALTNSIYGPTPVYPTMAEALIASEEAIVDGKVITLDTGEVIPEVPPPTPPDAPSQPPQATDTPPPASPPTSPPHVAPRRA
jgi:hypothetical protein